jgi:RNA polymerase sigma factor (sigma-70 family)
MTRFSAHSLVTLTRLLAARPDADDASLLARYQAANDPAAFTELVRRHGPLVFGVCRRMLGHAHDAEDAFQATFLALVHSARSVRKPNALAAWLYGAAVRVCRKALSRRGTRLPAARAPASPEPLDDVAWKEVRGLLDDELSRLPAAYRDPLVLCYFDGLTRDEAAERLGLSRRTLMRRLEQARLRLRRKLERRGVGALGLGAAVLAPEGLAARVPPELLTAAVRVGTGGPASAAVRALAGGASVKLLNGATWLTLLLLAGGGLGLAAGLTRSAPPPPAVTPQAPAAAKAEARAEAPRLDADGRLLPAGAVHRLGSRRFRVEGGWSCFALPTPDGKHVLVQPQPRLSASAAQGLMLLDAATGLRVRAFEDGRRVPKVMAHYVVRPAAFSPDGATLYAVANLKDHKGDWWGWDHLPCARALLVWDVATGKVKAEWPLPHEQKASLLGVNVTPDGKRLFVYGRVSADFGVHVLDAATGKLLATWVNAGYLVGVTAGGKELVTHRPKASPCGRSRWPAPSRASSSAPTAKRSRPWAWPAKRGNGLARSNSGRPPRGGRSAG